MLRFNKVKSGEEERLSFLFKISFWKMKTMHAVNYTNKGTPSSYPALNHPRLFEYSLTAALQAACRVSPPQTGTRGTNQQINTPQREDNS